MKEDHEKSKSESVKYSRCIVNSKSGLNVRKKPNPRADILFIARADSILLAKPINETWSFVQDPLTKNQGYVMTSYLRKEDDNGG